MALGLGFPVSMRMSSAAIVPLGFSLWYGLTQITRAPVDIDFDMSHDFG
jgi:hypothetical protein